MRNLYCLNSYKMITVLDDCTKVLEVMLNKLVEVGWTTNAVTDDILEQYRNFHLLVDKEYSEEFINAKKT